jgi:ketosteroid isomerase-like protein
MAGGSIEDRLAISDLFVRYVGALDAGDVATVVDCFTPDATLESPVIGRIAGSAAIRAFAERFAAQRAAGTQFPPHGHQHRRRDWSRG